MHTPATERESGGGERTDERLAFARVELDRDPVEQRGAREQLLGERSLAERARRDLGQHGD